MQISTSKLKKQFLVERPRKWFILLQLSKGTVSQTTSQKHLGVILDSCLSFDKHLISVQGKTNKTIGLLHKLQNTLPREALITVYKAFVRPHLDYSDIHYDQVYNASFYQKLENIQYSACIGNNKSYSWCLERENIS